MHFELLARSHAGALLDFECGNRRYFEGFIEPRASRTYSAPGIREHIDELLVQAAAGSSSPWLLLHGGEVLARANLRKLASTMGTAEIGYRVAAAHTGRGIATRCVGHLIETAEQRFGVRCLQAAVLANNPASVRVLEKHGFRSVASLPAPVAVGGVLVDGKLYERDRRETVAPDSSAG